MKNVKIADLKAKLSEHLRYVKGGETVVVYDRDTPVAKIVPMGRTGVLRVREPAVKGRLRDVPLPPPLKLDVDIVDILLEERGDR